MNLRALTYPKAFWVSRGRLGRGPVSLGVAAATALTLLGCGPLTRAEVEASLEEAKLYSQAATLIGNSVELSSNFSIGGAVEDAAENLRAFYEAQLPCAEVTVDESTLTIEYGVTEEICLYQGMYFTGTHEVTIRQGQGADEIRVDHLWTELSNGSMRVSGSAQVTWSSGEDPSRRIVHDLVWERLSDSRKGQGTGDRTQRPLNGDLQTGIVVSGDAEWQGESGLWDLSIDGVELRWVDPLPQAGEYLLATPFDKSATFSFERTSPTSVRATATTGGKEYGVDVKTPE